MARKTSTESQQTNAYQPTRNGSFLYAIAGILATLAILGSVLAPSETLLGGDVSSVPQPYASLAWLGAAIIACTIIAVAFYVFGVPREDTLAYAIMVLFFANLAYSPLHNLHLL